VRVPDYKRAVAVLALLSSGCASPIVLDSSFVDPARPPTAENTRIASRPHCRLVVEALFDARTHLGALGKVGNRPVKWPTDFEHWMHSVLQGLNHRGIDTSFAGPEAAGSGLSATVTLRTAWVSTIETSKTATVVMHVQLRRGSQPLAQHDYRGSRTAVNWASAEAEVRRLIDHAFAQALDKLAADVRAECPAPAVS
jgi:hypothetical protein